jgi:hypothetical protein
MYQLYRLLFKKKADADPEPFFWNPTLSKSSGADFIFRRYKSAVTRDCTLVAFMRVSVQRGREAIPLNCRRLVLRLFILCIIFAQKREREESFAQRRRSDE